MMKSTEQNNVKIYCFTPGKDELDLMAERVTLSKWFFRQWTLNRVDSPMEQEIVDLANENKTLYYSWYISESGMHVITYHATMDGLKTDLLKSVLKYPPTKPTEE